MFCQGRVQKALEAGRKLMAEKDRQLDEDIKLSITLRSAPEWQPEDEGP